MYFNSLIKSGIMKYTTSILILVLFLAYSCSDSKKSAIDEKEEISKIWKEVDGKRYRDLNHNDKLDIYEDEEQPIAKRVDDLLAQMNIEEKAGMMFIYGTGVSTTSDPTSKEGIEGPAARMSTIAENINDRKMNHFNIWTIPSDPMIMAKWYNNAQLVAENSRLGIPVTIASDPRHHFSKNIFSMSANGFSQFCETLGLAALRDKNLVRQFAEIARDEYMAVGIRECLHPQIDLATEPRWARISGTFGEDAELSAELVREYILGFQGDELDENGVACMTKHFPGGGPQKEGLDPHFAFQKGQIYPGDNFDYHLIPFEAAFEVNTASIMPYYGVPTDQTDENVAMAYNKYIITELLRKKYKYDGVVCTDWGLITDVPMGPDVIWKARAWGVEDLSEADRVLKVIEAGCDQFGGENRTELVVQLLNEGKLEESRVDESIKRLLRQKFQLGLFDNPFVDTTIVNEVFNKEESIALGEKSQMEAMTLLKNADNTLPLKKEVKVYVENMDSSIVANYATVVSNPEDADFAILRVNTPWIPAETKNPFALGFHHGDLDFKGEEKERILSICKKVPTIFNIYLDRPAVIPDIAEASKAVIADYGANDKAACEVIFGNIGPKGKLPFELPSSMEAVANQMTDVPYDSKDPLYEYGHGLSYE